MNESVKRYDVTIGGQTYSLRTDGSQEEIAQAAVMIETALNQLVAQAPGVDARKVAVMVALQMAHKLVIAQAMQSRCHNHASELIDQVEQALPPLHG